MKSVNRPRCVVTNLIPPFPFTGEDNEGHVLSINGGFVSSKITLPSINQCYQKVGSALDMTKHDSSNILYLFLKALNQQ